MKKEGHFFRTSDEKNIYYEDYGSGPVLVLIPGFLCTTRFFDRNIPSLSEKHRVIVMDNRSFGNSTKSPCNLTIQRMGEDIKELLDYLDIDDATLIGWSMGGNIVMAFYEQFHNYRVSNLGIIDSTLYPYGPGETNAHSLRNFNLEGFGNLIKQSYDYRSYCEGFAKSLFKNPISKEDEEWIVQEALKCPPWLAFSLYEDFIHYDGEKVLEMIDIPVLLCCANSPRTPKGIEMCRGYAARVKVKYSYHEFKEAGHILFYESPEEFNQVILNFTDRADSTNN